MIGKDKGQRHERHGQPDDFISPFEHQGKMAHQPGGQRLCHLILVCQIVGDAADHIAEHDAHQGNHHHILKLNPLDKPDKHPGAEDGSAKGEQGAPPQGGGRHKQQRQQNAELRRRNRRAGCRGDKFVAAQLLHDEACHTHAHPCAQNGEKPRQSGNQKYLPRMQVAGCQPLQIDLDHAHKQRQDGQNNQDNR